MTQAKNIVRHSIVEYRGINYMIETNYNRGKVLLIPKDSGTGKEIKSDTQLKVVAHPAQLAMEFLNK